MPGLMNPEFVEHFTRIAGQAAEDNGLILDGSGEEALADLAERAAQEVDEGNPDEVARAEESFGRLASALAAEVGGASRQLGRVSGPKVDSDHVQKALLRLCPGFYPFC